jgi:hypothetical protein
MRDTPPAQLRRLLQIHNLHVLLVSLLALCAAVGVWVLMYYLGLGAVLAGRTFVLGEEAKAPSNYDLWYGGAVVLTLCAAFTWRFFHPPGRLHDRPIIGWHLIPELVLLPASLILGVSDNLAAYRRVGSQRLRTGWLLLQELTARGKLARPHLPRLGLDEHLLEESLLDLQYAGLIDLHEGKEEWFYRVRGTEEETVASWIRQQTRGLTDQQP